MRCSNARCSCDICFETEYSGVALVVSRPARPPLSSALARARAGQAGNSATATQADDPAAMPHADALVKVRPLYARLLAVEHAVSDRKTSVEAGDYMFVHAGVRPGVPLASQRQEDLLWIRDTFLDSALDHQGFQCRFPRSHQQSRRFLASGQQPSPPSQHRPCTPSN